MVDRMEARLLMSIALSCVLSSVALPAAALTVCDLRCEYRTDPLGIDTAEPRLSWILDSDVRGQKQTAYRILVAAGVDELSEGKGSLWDSGIVESDQSVHVMYRGRPLQSRMRCYWKVRVWDKDGRESAWSAPASWSMGLLHPGDWQGRWIGASDQRDPPRPRRVAGYHAAEAAKADEVKWVQVDLGADHRLDKVTLYPPTPSGFDHVQGFGFPVRFRIEASRDSDFGHSRTLADFTGGDYPNPGDEPRMFAAGDVQARYVRVTATQLWNRTTGERPFCFALAELEVRSKGANVALHAAVQAKDSVEYSGWNLKRLTDGERPEKPSATIGAALRRPERTREQRNGVGADESDDPPYAALLLRKQIDLPQQPVRATAYISGLGYYELHINGHKAGDHVLDPGFTDYTHRVLYVTYDVTDLLRSGRSAVGVVLGSGWYDSPATDVWTFHLAPWIAPPKLLLQLDIEYGDGTRETVVSDASWKCATGPIVFNSIRGGETHDARRAKSGWDQPDYDDSTWRDVKIAPAPGGQLCSQFHPPIRATASIRPVQLTEPKPGMHVFDLGVNTAGWARLNTSGPRGTRVKLEYGESLNADGTVNMEYLAGLTRGRFQTDECVLAGEGVETYEPRFTYHGFRYVQVTGLARSPTLDSLVGIRVHTDPEPAGEFACSNPTVNRIQEMILRTQLTNIHGLPSDCPHREKIGWTGDGYITMEEAIYNFRMPTFYLKWWRDMVDVQDDNGHASPIAPSPGWGRSQPDGSPGILSDPWWGGAIVRLPWKHYCYYGDRRILEQAYEPMKKYLGYVAAHAPGHISWGAEGDWLEVGVGGSSTRTPPQLAGTAAYFYHARIVAEIAKLLGKSDDAAEYSKLAEEISASFHKEYFDPQTGLYAKDSQTAQAMPLCFGMTSPDKRELVLQRLLEDVRETRDNHISSGIIGTYYVFQALMETGHDDVAYAILTRHGFPGWVHMLDQGATTVWESWTGDGSRNHPALGSIGAWFYEGLAGIRLDPTTTAFKKIIIKPAIVGDLTWVKTHHESLYGRIVSDWKREGDRLTMHITIPANTTATVYVPTTRPDAVEESGRPVTQAEAVRFLRAEARAAVYGVGSGNYVFGAPFISSGVSQ